MSRSRALTTWDPEDLPFWRSSGLGAPDVVQAVVKRGYRLALAT